MKLVRESLFSSTIRSFCISFFAVIGIVVAVFLVMVVFGAGKTSKALEMSMYDVVIPDTNGRKYMFTNNQPLLLRLNVTGQIGLPNLNTETVRSILNESVAGPFKNHPIKGILLYINTPGGSAFDSESIYNMLKDYSQKYQVPIYAFVEGLCASGGMFIACSADKVYSTESSVIGSVGVVAMYFNVSEGMQKVGLQNQTLTAGAHKADMNPFQPWTEDSATSMKEIIALNYDQFVSVVSSARPKLTESLLKNKYGANVYYSTQAAEYGYTDGTGYQYNEVVEMLAKAADIDSSYQVIELQPKIHFSDLFKMSNQMLSSSEKLKSIFKNPFFFMSPNRELPMQMMPAQAEPL